MSTTTNGPTAVTAVSASTFVQSIGVNIHVENYWSNYANTTLVESELAYLGIDQVRDKFVDWSNLQSEYAQLAAAGVKFDMQIPVYTGGSNTVNLPEFISMLDGFVQSHPGSVTAIEGPNEVNIWPVSYAGGTTPADEALLQQALYAVVEADPNLNNIPVYNLSLGTADPNLFSQLGNLSSAASYANSHAYLGNEPTPAAGLAYLLPIAQIDASGLPTVITETGYETNAADSYSGVDPTDQAKLTLDLLLDAFKDGVSKTYLYDLMDDGQSFGLFTANGAPKLVATALHDLTSLLSDNGSTQSFTPGSLSYAASLPANGNQLLLEKSNGTFDLVLWAEFQIWDATTESEMVAPAETSTIQFAQAQNVVLVFDPLQGTMPISAYLNTQSIQVTLTDHPIIVETPTIEIRPWRGLRSRDPLRAA